MSGDKSDSFNSDIDDDLSLISTQSNSTLLYSDNGIQNSGISGGEQSSIDVSVFDSSDAIIGSDSMSETTDSDSIMLFSENSSTSKMSDRQTRVGLKFWYTNADSYLNKREEMMTTIETQNVIVITELFPKTVKATELDIVEFKIDGYNMCMSKVEEMSRGVGLYIQENLAYTECSVLNNKPFKESCWCELQLKNNEKMMIRAVYRSPSSGLANNIRLNHLISLATGFNFNYTVILGDFNHPDINWNEWTTEHNETHSEFQFLECLRDSYLSQERMTPTRYRVGQRSNILD